AIGVSSIVFGESEFSARAPSALAMTLAPLLSFIFATRWFGRPWGLAAGIAHALTPLFFYPGRSAEIESLHNLFAQATMLGCLELLVHGPRRRTGWAFMLSLSFAGMALLKGPSAIPCLAGALIAPCLVRRSLAPLRAPALWGGL